MRTWSLESVFVRAYSAVVDKLAVLEGLTRPPRRPSVDYDEPVCPHDECDYPFGACSWQCGAEQLAKAEAEEEVREPVPLAEWEIELLGAEPALTNSELVAVRQLIEDRFGDQTSSADPLQASATCGDAGTADDSPSADDGHSPRPPAEGHPTWAGLAERMVNHLPSAKAEDDFQPLNKNELWTAGNCVANWAASDDCADNPGYQKYLRRLATRLRDASRAIRNQK